ncbi:MAG: phosphohydrolase [Spirochaetes bacterium]|nr:MAG: phosphohydrolase [Spirochaetota bacterium]
MDFKELLNAGEVEIRRWVKGSLKKDKVPINQLISLKNINDAVRKILNTEEVSTFGFNDRTLISRIVSEFAEEDCFLNREETLSKRQKVYNEVEPVLGKLVKGQVIIRKGDIVTEPIKSKIDALGEYSFQINVKGITGTVLFLALLFILTLYLLSENIIGIKLNREQIRLLAGLTVSYTTIAVVLFRVSGVSGWIPFSVIIPTATFAILVTILVSEHAGIIVSLFMALLLVLIAKMDIYTFLFAFFSGVGASTLAQKTEKRINLITSGLYMAGFNAGFLIILGFFKNYNFSQFMAAIGWGFGNGFLCSIFALGFLPILEQIMNAPTVFRLMELSDLNAPAMKKMLALAPGTYNHSVIVANLGEFAAREIGANPLIARVGGYYHDIGKVDQAEYFVENQRSFNKHDELKPSLSAAVIKSHVKIGIEKGKELKLPRVIIDIIGQHHGKTLIKYFYQRAKEGKGNGKITPEDYSYPGERPKSKEAAVIMLADHVEAASRTLKRPSVAKLERIVWDIIIEKFNSGELNESELTLRDLEIIKNSFVQILAGYFHTRIEYPKLNEANI